MNPYERRIKIRNERRIKIRNLCRGVVIFGLVALVWYGLDILWVSLAVVACLALGIGIVCGLAWILHKTEWFSQ